MRLHVTGLVILGKTSSVSGILSEVMCTIYMDPSYYINKLLIMKLSYHETLINYDLISKLEYS